MKKILMAIILMLCLSLCSVFTACGGKETDNTEQDSKTDENGATSDISSNEGENDRDDPSIHKEHLYGEWSTVEKPTCTESGRMIRECSCGASESKAIEATGHNYIEFKCTSCEAESVIFKLYEEEQCYSVWSIWDSSIKEITIPSVYKGLPVTIIDDMRSTGLEKITIPSSIARIESDAFEDCHSLKEVHIEDISAWCNVSFGEFDSNPLDYGELYINGELVVDLVIPEGVERVNCGFGECEHIKSIRIPSTLKYISSSFSDSLESVYISDVSAWCGIDFYGSMYSNPLSKATKLYVNDVLTTKLVIPEGTAIIKENAFSGFVGLVSITIPADTDVQYAFMDCYKLVEVYGHSGYRLGPIVNGHVYYYAKDIYDDIEIQSKISVTEDGFIFYQATNQRYELLGYIGDEKELVLPDKYDDKYYDIASYAFIKSALTSVTILDGVQNIGKYAFCDCGSLKRVALPEYMDEIEQGAFYGCISLKDIVLPKDINHISEHLFGECVSLESIIIPKSVKEIKKSAFAGCEKLESITIPSNVEFIGDSAFSRCKSIKAVVIPESVVSLGKAFENCISLERVSLLSAITSIGGFSGCTSLSEIVLPDTIEEIDYGAFSRCYNLKTINLPKGLKVIGSHAFEESGLNSITIPGGVVEIGTFAFYGCKNLETVVLESGIKCIAPNAFCNSAIKSVVIPNTVETIGIEAFLGCKYLTSIIIPTNVKHIGTGAFASCEKVTIYCEAESQPSDWDEQWNYENYTVVWGYKYEK